MSGVSDGGVADRVAVDFTTLLSNDEGLLVGSSAKALALVLGETATGGFVPPRPFRVNAGPVHSYVLAAGGKTTYLSEVSAGDTLVVASTDGSTREATVGRAKVEPRPCVQVDLQREKGPGSGQQAWRRTVSSPPPAGARQRTAPRHAAHRSATRF